MEPYGGAEGSGTREGRQKQPMAHAYSLQAVVNSRTVAVVSALLTVYALYVNEIRLLAFDASADLGFLIATACVLLLLTLEVCITSLVKPVEYLQHGKGFYFWLDVIATGSLALDLLPLLDTAGVSSSTLAGHQQNAQLARAARASRAGARAGRVARLARLVRLFACHPGNFTTSPAATGGGFANGTDGASRVGRRLSETTTRRLIVGVLLLVLTGAAFEPSSYPSGVPALLLNGGLEMLHKQALASASGCSAPLDDAVLDSARTYVSEANVIELLVCGVDVSSSIELDSSASGMKLRASELADTRYLNSSATANVRWEESELPAILTLCSTTFVLCILSIGTLLFIRDANLLVIRPLERMVERVQSVAKNPVQDIMLADATAKSRAPTDAQESQMTNDRRPSKGTLNVEEYETQMLDGAISKICNLLAIGFGRAGAHTIADNIRSDDGSVNPIVPGRRVAAVFAFCDIRGFTAATEFLQEEVMEFVNVIAFICHNEVVRQGGSPNKNTGDAFLLVWRLPYARSPTSEEATQAADSALTAFLSTVARIRRSPSLQSYAERVGMPDGQVRLGFGLHVGWAIEGAVGSEYKVDATYLSPNVNTAARLESATKQLRTDVLMSATFASLLSHHFKRHVRHVDNAVLVGQSEPSELYTLDADVSLLDQSSPDEGMLLPAHCSPMHALAHPIVSQMLPPMPEFKKHFARGIAAYFRGSWQDAKVCFERALERKWNQDDGPTRALLAFMNEYHFTAPPDWPGYRYLPEK